MILVVVFVSLLTLYVQQTEALPLEDQLPEDTGLFFGKRSSHNPNFNNLLFGRSVLFLLTIIKLISRVSQSSLRYCSDNLRMAENLPTCAF